LKTIGCLLEGKFVSEDTISCLTLAPVHTLKIWDCGYRKENVLIGAGQWWGTGLGPRTIGKSLYCLISSVVYICGVIKAFGQIRLVKKKRRLLRTLSAASP
jgi:hypothetical protein